MEICNKYNAVDAVVKSVKKKKSTLDPGKLYSLSKLQNVLGKKYKMSMAESLEIVQRLYEQGYLTYPRTNSEYLATAEQDKIRKIIANCQKIGYPVEFKFKKTIFDDSKIESHSALTPTYKIPDKNKLSEKEMQVYSTVFRRFIAVFCAEDCCVEKTEIVVAVGDYEEFVLKGTVIVEPGWTKYDENSQKDKILPKLSKGDIVNTKFTPTEKETSPPKHYTIETLNNYLKNPFKEDKLAAKEKSKEQQDDNANEFDDEDDYKAIFEGLELGTEATRTGIIDNARKSEYILLKKDVYTILPQGIFLIEALSRLNIIMDKYKTSQMGQALKKIYHGDITIKDGVALAQSEISDVFNHEVSNETTPLEKDMNTGCFGDIVGKCPLCGNEVLRGRYYYGCKGYKEGCGFKVGIYICGRPISVSNIRLLLEEGRTSKIEGFISKKSGKSFDGRLKLENGEAKFDFSQ
jgi:DNA topoisomerase-3